MIAILDYGVGNVQALLNMYEHLGFDAFATDNADTLAESDRIILPGVGAFDAAMSKLREKQLIPALEYAVMQRKVPFLGICLGMQLLARDSEEGSDKGLGWIEASVKRINIPLNSLVKVPHIGWEEIMPTCPTMLFPANNTSERFYFVHSYHVVCDHYAHICATVDYGGRLCCAVNKGNIWGVQFHPEKSHRYGMRLLSSFASEV